MKCIYILMLMLFSVPVFSQQAVKTDTGENAFVKQILNLKEFKFESHRIDSLRKAKSAPNVISFSILRGYLMETDSLNHLWTGFIEEGLLTPTGNTMDKQNIYTIKFDQKQKKIVSVGNYRPWQ